jgi:hypothetical protein
MTSNNERGLIHGLAKEIAEIAHLPVQKKKISLWKDLNSLRMKRPMVLTYSFPWNEAEGHIEELKVLSEDPFNRRIERHLRRLLFKWHTMRADMVIEPVYFSPIYIDDTGCGFDSVIPAGKGISLCDNIHTIEVTDPQAAEEYKSLLTCEADIANIRFPKISINQGKTEEEYRRSCELLEPVIRVEKRGFHSIWCSPMDDLAKLWGINELMIDMTERPSLIHAAMDKLINIHIERLDQLEKLNLLSLNSRNAGVITQGMGECYTDELPAPGFDPDHIRPKDLWGGATAQIFSGVSPAMHDEFSLTHEKKWLEKFGLASYGCCEPLHKKIDALKKIKNLRKISMSSWINIEEAAENIGKNYVFSYKPKPTFLAMEVFDLQPTREEMKKVLEEAREYGCNVEFILRTIISYRHEPKRLSEWVKMAMAMVGAEE